MAFSLSSPAFATGDDIPQRYTCDGDDVPPELSWTGAPDGTASFALIVDDPDAPRGTFTHWIVFDIPPSRHDLRGAAGSAAAGVTGRNSAGQMAYMGPCPPSGTHRYFFRLFALDVKTLGLKAGAPRDQVDRAIAAHTVATAELMGRYARTR